MKKSITIMLTAIFSLQLLSMVTFAEETVGAIENKTLGEMVVVDVVGEETPEV